MGYGRSISGDFESLAEYYKYPDRLATLLQEERIRLNFPFFDWDLPELLKIFNILYPESEQNDINKTKEAFKNLDRGLRKIKQYFSQAHRHQTKINLSSRFDDALNNFNESLPSRFKKEELKPLSVNRIDELLDHIKRKLSFPWFREDPKIGRPLEAFSSLIFYVVNRFAWRCFDSKHRPIMKGDKLRVRKNWQLIIDTILWIHAQYGIPEIRKFEIDHKNEQLNLALEKLKVFIKKEYQNFRRSNKGFGKFRSPFQDSSDFLDFTISRLKDDRTICIGRL